MKIKHLKKSAWTHKKILLRYEAGSTTEVPDEIAGDLVRLGYGESLEKKQEKSAKPASENKDAGAPDKDKGDDSDVSKGKRGRGRGKKK